MMGAPDDPPTDESVLALFADPHAALLETIQPRKLWKPLLAAPRPSLRTIVMYELGGGGELLEKNAPNLEELTLTGLDDDDDDDDEDDDERGEPATRIHHSNLRRLSTSYAACPAIATGAYHLPRLESLAGYGLGELFRESSILFRPPPSLQRLELTSFRRWDDAVERLARSPLMRQLRCLTLSGVSVAQIEEITKLAPQCFGHLQEIHMSPRDFDFDLDRAAIDALRDRLTRALPSTKLDVDWNELFEDESYQAPPVPPVDAASRDSLGRIDPILAFFQAGKKD
jgi:hypothetical protein